MHVFRMEVPGSGSDFATFLVAAGVSVADLRYTAKRVIISARVCAFNCSCLHVTIHVKASYAAESSAIIIRLVTVYFTG